MHKIEKKISSRCIRTRMLLNERLLHVRRLRMAAQHSVRVARTTLRTTCTRAAKRKQEHKRRTESYWKKMNSAGQKFVKAMKTGLCCICVSCHRLLYR